VSPQVEAVLDAGRRYPPALALARDEAALFPNGTSIDRGAFAERYAARVAHHMSLQPFAPYVLVEAVGDEPGYLARGQFYWVLRYLRGAGTVRWVSEDWHVYENSAYDFRLSDEQLGRLLLPFDGSRLTSA
jgi:hypothetical protein